MTEKFSVPKGMKDIMPDEMAKREYIYNKIKGIFYIYGFQLVEASSVENLETLVAKSGPEIENEIYAFKDKSERKIALRFDLTVGMARMVSSTQLPRPIKLACISNMWRYENPQFGRYRTFYQWDAEIYGCESEIADAEIIAMTCDILQSFDLNYKIKISNRKLVEGILIENGVKKTGIVDALRIIDKMKKIDEKDFVSGMKKIGVKKQGYENIMKLFKAKDLDEIKTKNKLAQEGIDELKRLLDFLESYGCEKKCELDLSTVRGIDYYTGIVYEAVVVGEENVGSVAGGGRYDDLLKIYGPTMPATGIAGGIERMLLTLENKSEIKRIKAVPKFQVVYVNDSLFGKAIEITQKIRKHVACDIDLSKKNFTNQMKSASSRGVSFVVIVGDKELKEEKVKIRNMSTGQEHMVDLKNIENIKNLEDF